MPLPATPKYGTGEGVGGARHILRGEVMAGSLLNYLLLFFVFLFFLFLLLGGWWCWSRLSSPSLFERGVLEAWQDRTGQDRTGQERAGIFGPRLHHVNYVFSFLFYFPPSFSLSLPLTLFLSFLASSFAGRGRGARVSIDYGSKLRDTTTDCAALWGWDRHSMAHGARGVIEMGADGMW